MKIETHIINTAFTAVFVISTKEKSHPTFQHWGYARDFSFVEMTKKNLKSNYLSESTLKIVP